MSIIESRQDDNDHSAEVLSQPKEGTVPKQTTATFTANQVAEAASKATGANWSGSRIRGLVRGDGNGRPLIKRLADERYTKHAYTAAERDVILAAVKGDRKPATKVAPKPATRRAAAPAQPASQPTAPVKA